MGRRLCALADEDPRLEVAARVDPTDPEAHAALNDVSAQDVDVVIDFSIRAQVVPTATWCGDHGVPLVLGTTGLDVADEDAVQKAASRTPVLDAPNFSVGVNALFALAAQAARMLDDGWDLEVVEAHHRRKVDAPSGTASRLVQVLADARRWDVEATRRPGRDGLVGARPSQEIGVHAVRGGDVVGEHTVFYLADGEEIRVSHRAQSRDIFVRGALRAARWIAGREPGRYGMQDVLAGG